MLAAETNSERPPTSSWLPAVFRWGSKPELPAAGADLESKGTPSIRRVEKDEIADLEDASPDKAPMWMSREESEPTQSDASPAHPNPFPAQTDASPARSNSLLGTEAIDSEPSFAEQLSLALQRSPKRFAEKMAEGLRDCCMEEAQLAKFSCQYSHSIPGDQVFVKQVAREFAILVQRMVFASVEWWNGREWMPGTVPVHGTGRSQSRFHVAHDRDRNDSRVQLRVSWRVVDGLDSLDTDGFDSNLRMQSQHSVDGHRRHAVPASMDAVMASMHEQIDATLQQQKECLAEASERFRQAQFERIVADKLIRQEFCSAEVAVTRSPRPDFAAQI